MMRRHGARVVPRTEADGDFVGGVDGLGGGDVDLVVFDVPEGDSAGPKQSPEGPPGGAARPSKPAASSGSTMCGCENMSFLPGM